MNHPAIGVPQSSYSFTKKNMALLGEKIGISPKMVIKLMGHPCLSHRVRAAQTVWTGEEMGLLL